MTEDEFNLARSIGELRATQMLFLWSQVRCGQSLRKLRSIGWQAVALEQLGITELHAQLMVQTSSRFDELRAAGKSEPDAFDALIREGLFERLSCHIATRVEVAHGA